MRVQLSGITLALDDSNPFDSSLPVILFIHGYPLSRKLWQPQGLELAKSIRVITPDLRGFGESEASAGPYSMELLADDCVALLDRLEINNPVVVCGLSMGGYITFALYKKYPQRVKGLILSSTRPGGDSPEAKANRDKAIVLVEKEGVQAIASTMLPKMFATDTYTHETDRVDFVQHMMLSSSVAGIKGVLQGMRDRPDSTDLLSQIEVPTLLIYGDQDQFVSQSEVQNIYEAIPVAQLHFIKNTGHLLNLEQPGQYNTLIRNFLEEIPRD